MGTPVTAATQTAPTQTATAPPAPPATHTLLPTTWLILSGGTGLFPKAEHQMLKGEEKSCLVSFPAQIQFYIPPNTESDQSWILMFRTCSDFKTSLWNIRQSGYMVDEGFVSVILVTTLPNNPNTPGSWHTWIIIVKVKARIRGRRRVKIEPMLWIVGEEVVTSNLPH
ncbi:hypothetical protein BT96DRAFT_949132 [Gymnopus androsaceus JB14]|uniref:Uncharacterized protein n=1 Tax=Gymnopus androsaceus JB14 TaxID=1447944 RepID=A0A6A4GKY5_9AGAR|nr:hypothetical protein BT96DRAFT_949132 [Gymnopus androsaceus JB14]